MNLSKTKQIKIQASDFFEISTIWKESLWPLRISPIEPISWINSEGKIDMTLKLGGPSFFTARFDGKIIGVISGYKTSEREYRSRGIWVDEKFRKMGIGRKLMEQIFIQAKLEKCNSVWTMPRMSAKEFYISLGFHEKKLVEGYEYGPHIIAHLKLSTDSN